MVKADKLRLGAVLVVLILSFLPSLTLASAASLLGFILSAIVASVILFKNRSEAPRSILICHAGVTFILFGAIYSAVRVILISDPPAEFGIDDSMIILGYVIAAIGLLKAAKARHATSGMGDVIDAITSSLFPLALLLTYLIPYALDDSIPIGYKISPVLFACAICFLFPVIFLLIYGSGKRSAGATWAGSAGLIACTLTVWGIVGQITDSWIRYQETRFFALGFVCYAIAVSHPSLRTFAMKGTRPQVYRWSHYLISAFLMVGLHYFTNSQVSFVGLMLMLLTTIMRLRIANTTNVRLDRISKIHFELASNLAENDTIEDALDSGYKACCQLMGDKCRIMISSHGISREQVDVDSATVVSSESNMTRIYVDGEIPSYRYVALEQIANVVDFAVGSLESRVKKATALAEKSWKDISRTDQVTQLRNQADFEQQKLLADNVIAIFHFSDVDRIAEIKGNKESESLMKIFAQRAHDMIRGQDSLWRGNGPRLIMRSDYSGSNTFDWIEAKRQKLAEEIEIEGEAINPLVSAGLVIVSNNMSSASVLLRAEMAMKYGQSSGKLNQTVLFDQELEEKISRRWKIESGFSSALRNPVEGGFEVYYQPILNARTQKVEHIEALARWTHPELGSISPAEFIPAAERAGLVSAIDNFVLNTALNDMDTLRAVEPDLSIQVNMSPVDLSPQRIREAGNTVMLARGRSNNVGITFELIESAIGVYPLEELSSAMSYVRELGIGFSIDDFGTGESNFNRLSKLPFTQIKLANQFIQSGDSLLVESMLRTASDLRLQSVVEGVETQDQYNVAKSSGADYIQGWYFAKATTLDELIDYILKLKASNSVSNQEIHIDIASDS